MNDRLHLMAASRRSPNAFAALVTQTVSSRTAHECQPPSQTKSLRYTLIVGLAFFCLSSVLCRSTLAQGQTITVGVLEFQDESGAAKQVSPAPEIARQLAQKLNATHKELLARHSMTAANVSSIQAMSVEQLVELGKQQGFQFVVRGGLLSSSEGDSTGETVIQLYADIVSVETLSMKSVRARGDSAQKDQAWSSAIEQLAGSIHQALGSPTSEAAAVASSQDTSSEIHPPDDSPNVDAAQDEELQQLIAQAESLVGDGSNVTGAGLNSLGKALESLKAALEAKATLLEEGKESTSADQEIARQKELLQNSLSALAESEMSGAADASGDQVESDEQPSGEKKSLLARIDGYAGETLSILQKIQEMRTAFRGVTGSAQQNETSGTESTEEAPLSTEESTEEISGVITEMGEPVAGVTVTEPESGATTETDSDGSYALEGVPAGRLAKLVVTKKGKEMATGRIDIARGRKAIADFELREQTQGATRSALRILPATARFQRTKITGENPGVLKGVVKDAQGRPVRLALVRVGRTMARTDFQGRYSFLNVPPGNHKIMVQRSGSKPKTEMVQVSARKGTESRIQLADDKIANPRSRHTLLVRGKGNVLRGLVMDSQKRPLAGAKVTVVQKTSAVSALAGARGNYLLRDLMPGTYRVLVSRVGYTSTAQSVTLHAGEMPPLDFQLRKTDSPFIESALARRRSNQSRTARDTGLKTDQRINREDQPRAKVVNANEPFRVEARVGGLRGRVSDSRTGRPVSGATISILGRRRAQTDDEGNYSVKDAPSGSFQMTVKRTGFAEQERSVRVLEGNSTQENFALVAENARHDAGAERRTQFPAERAERAEARRASAERPEIRRGQLNGRILHANTGRPIPGAFVSVGRRTATSDRNGAYAFDDVAPGDYRVVAKKPTFVDGLASLVVRPGETTTTNLRLMPKTSARVR